MIDPPSRAEAAAQAAAPAPVAALLGFLNTLDERTFRVRGQPHHGADTLASPEALAGWLADHGLAPAGARATPADLAAAHALRAAFRQALTVRALAQDPEPAATADGDGVPPRQDAGLTAVLADAGRALAALPLQVAFAGDGSPRLVPLGRAEQDPAEHGAAGPDEGGPEHGPTRQGAAGQGATGHGAAGDGAGRSPVRAGLATLAAAAASASASGLWRRVKICAAPDCRWVFYDHSRSGAGRWCSMNVCGNRDKTRAYRRRQRA